MREIIVDNFAGGGGASTGIEMAIGRSVDIAINHDPAAIAMHKVNHPGTEHYCESVWDVDPVKACKGRPVGLAWFSPDCKHFSKAKGGKPVEKKIRGLAWIVLKWAGKVRPRVIILENVEEFVTWGPIRKGRPIKSKRGQTFEQWKNQLIALGYKVDHRELRASDYGAPTTRNRFFLVARCDGLPIIWPKVTHGDPNGSEVRLGKLKPWRTAAEIIDWSIPCPSIFERKRPLADNTLRRIAKGIQKFVIDNPDPFIIQYHSFKGQDFRGQEIDKPIQTIDTSNRYGLIVPFISKYFAGYYTGAGASAEGPLPTVTAIDHNALVTSFITKFYKTGIGQTVKEPLHTVTTSPGHFGEVRTFLMTYYGNSEDLGQKVGEPLRTITTKDRFGIVTVAGQDYQIIDIGMRMLEPRELFNAQSFPEDYIIDRDCEGKAYPRSEQVARCGNAVPPLFAKALTMSNLPEYCLNEQAS
jgi:DNA (cytosine-5)-methyltransferase 1